MYGKSIMSNDRISSRVSRFLVWILLTPCESSRLGTITHHGVFSNQS